MLIPKVNRNEVYKALFSEGVIWAKKDYNLPKHPEVGQSGENPIDVPNLQVIKLMQSFKSKGFVNEIFSWRHYYWYLTDEGIEYLREYLMGMWWNRFGTRLGILCQPKSNRRAKPARASPCL